MTHILILVQLLSVVILSPRASANCTGELSSGGAVQNVIWDTARDLKFAEMLITRGVDFRVGDKVMIQGDRGQSIAINLVAAQLRDRGAADVLIFYCPTQKDVRTALRLGLSPAAYVEIMAPRHLVQRLTDQRYASINIQGSDDPDEVEGIDLITWWAYVSAHSVAFRPYVELMMSSQVRWTLAELPTARQARLMWPNLQPADALSRLKQSVSDVYRLDEEDPSRRWQETAREIEHRTGALNSLRIKQLRYIGPGTDLTIELHPAARWKGGRDLHDGRATLANFPTFETYVSPMYRSTRGTVRVTRPMRVFNRLVSGAWFEFSDGAVVNYGAESGKNALDLFIAEDPRNAYLGEVALVAHDSPVAQHPLFHSIVFDENATSHLALGSAYPCTWTKPYPAGCTQLEAAQLNQAFNHLDFMIGHDELNITAQTEAGQLIPLMQNGKLTLQR